MRQQTVHSVALPIMLQTGQWKSKPHRRGALTVVPLPQLGGHGLIAVDWGVLEAGKAGMFVLWMMRLSSDLRSR